MHNAAFQKLGLDYLYVPFQIREENLAKAIDGMRALNIRGLNVTIPYKQSVLPFLDRIDDCAKKIGAVNTIVNENGTLTGYNTDAEGFLLSLKENRVDPKGQKVVIIGSGGAARAIAFALMENGAHICIHNRSRERVVELVRDLKNMTGSEVELFSLDSRSLQKTLEHAGILVNTTSVGMSPEINDSPVPAELLKAGLIIYDVVYNPIKTRLLMDGEAARAKTISGIDMLVFQGAIAFEKFTGRTAPKELMKEVAIRQLKAYSK
jgi:shikimate dehydrogenase